MKNDSAGAWLLFIAADATWRYEAAKVFGWNAEDPDLVQASKAHGEMGTLLRISYEVRERAYAEWQHILKRAVSLA